MFSNLKLQGNKNKLIFRTLSFVNQTRKTFTLLKFKIHVILYSQLNKCLIKVSPLPIPKINSPFLPFFSPSLLKSNLSLVSLLLNQTTFRNHSQIKVF